jgi:hypothetical protein
MKLVSILAGVAAQDVRLLRQRDCWWGCCGTGVKQVALLVHGTTRRSRQSQIDGRNAVIVAAVLGLVARKYLSGSMIH